MYARNFNLAGATLAELLTLVRLNELPPLHRAKSQSDAPYVPINPPPAMTNTLKKLLFAVSLAALVGLTLYFSLLARRDALRALTPPVSAARSQPRRPLTGPAFAGKLLVAPRRELRVPRGGHVTNVYVSEGQRVGRGEVLLKLTVGTGAGLAFPVFVVAPATGEVTSLRVGVGPYLAAGTSYALLVMSSPVLVQVPAEAAAALQPGDSVTVVTGPPGLASRCSVLGEVRPGRAPAAAVLTLPNLRWPPPRPAALTLAVLLRRSPSAVPTLAER